MTSLIFFVKLNRILLGDWICTFAKQTDDEKIEKEQDFFEREK